LLSDVLKNHSYPKEISLLLSEALLLTALIGEMIKLRWRLSLQVRGNGPVKLLATDYFGANKNRDSGRLRAYADFDKSYDFSSLKNPSNLLGKGVFSITIDQGKNMEPYQGITELVEGSLSRSAENYFLQSEQIPTHFSLNISETHGIKKGSPWRALGIMIQDLPNLADKKVRLHSDRWQLITTKLNEKLEASLTISEFNEYEFLKDVFETNLITVYKPKNIKFGCSCRKEKLLSTLKRHSNKELTEMSDSQGLIKADCQFCGKVYKIKLSSIVSSDDN
jgi:molecular chaperone Hsp33